MASCLLVPIRIEALMLEKGRSAVRGMADFSRLPYVYDDGNGRIDVNGQYPPVSATVASEPLSDTDLWLKPGVHLHWALPTALTTAVHPCDPKTWKVDEDRFAFPAVPNRWLVCRRLGEAVQATWIVESDYLWSPAHNDPGGDLVTYPYEIKHEDGAPRFVEKDGTPAFRYLGRSRPLGRDWAERDPGSHLKDIHQRLTALGHGELTFAAFYPNCRSVFGHHDPVEPAAAASPELWYEVFGWYDDPADDPLRTFIAALDPRHHASVEAFVDRYEAMTGRKLRFQLNEKKLGRPFEAELEKFKIIDGQTYSGKTAFLAALAGAAGVAPGNGLREELIRSALFAPPEKLFEERLAARFGWTWSAKEASDRVLCYGRTYRESFAPETVDSASGIQVAVGSSGTEAVAAFIASRLARDRYDDEDQQRSEKARIENHLEALDLASVLEGERLDIGAKLELARHSKSFRGVDGSPVWRIHPWREPGAAAAAGGEQGLTLPLDVARALNFLNAFQQTYDRGRHEVAAKRWQLYSDWYRYMLHAYPSGDEVRDFLAARSAYGSVHDVDVLIEHIDSHALKDLDETLIATGEVASLEPGEMAVTVFRRADSRERIAPSTLHLENGTWRTTDGVEDVEPVCLAQVLVHRLELLRGLLEGHNSKLPPPRSSADPGPTADAASSPTGEHWVLAQSPGPRYWQPNDPVVLLAGAGTGERGRWESRDTRLHDKEGRLVCRSFDGSDLDLERLARSDADLSLDHALVERLASGELGKRLAVTAKELGLDHPEPSGTRPLFLEWRAELHAVRRGGNLLTAAREYDPDFVRKNWSLAESDHELAAPTAPATLIRGSSPVRGRGVLSAYAPGLLSQRLDGYIERRLKQRTIPVAKQSGKALSLLRAAEMKEEDKVYKSWHELHAETTSEMDEYERQDRIRRHLVRMRSERELLASSAALFGMNKVDLPPSTRDRKRVHGIPDVPATTGEIGGGLAKGILDLINDQEGHPAEASVFFADHVGLDRKLADRLARSLASGVEIGSLAELDRLFAPAEGASPAAPELAAAPFARLLRHADASGRIGNGGKPQAVFTHPPVNGLPDGAGVAAAILRFVTNAEPEELRSPDTGAGLDIEAVGEILEVRALHELKTLAQLDELRGVTSRSFARLVAFVDQKGWFDRSKENDSREVSTEPRYEDEYGHHWVDPMLSAFDAANCLHHTTDLLTQSLSGFNDALLMRRQGWQLPVFEPLAFDEYRAFSEEVVRPAVGERIGCDPLEQNDFHPIRSGELDLIDLRLVDTFGQPQRIQASNIVTTEKLFTPRLGHVALPPRLTQPARLHLRFLDAEGDEEEWNTHPAATPICGWVAADNLEGSLLIYQANGELLGTVDPLGRWRLPPAGRSPVRPEDIANPHLARMVSHFCHEGARSAREAGPGDETLVESVGGMIEAALENIEPPVDHDASTRTLLTSRPVALVRIRTSIELRDPCATRQNLSALAHELSGQPRQTDGFEKVRFPVRIGEHQRFDDGVVAYAVEEGRGYRERKLYWPQTEWQRGADETLSVYREAGGAQNLWLSLDDDPQVVTVLMDPRGPLHATCGVLPSKRLRLPRDQFAGALGRMQGFFLAAPLLTESGRVQVFLPDEPGWRWSWIADQGDRWETLPETPVLELAALEKAFPGPGGRDVRQKLEAAGALAAIPGDPLRARLEPARLPAALKVLGQALGEPLAADVKRYLEVTSRFLERPATGARFLPQELREGWLRLSPDTESTTRKSEPEPNGQ